MQTMRRSSLALIAAALSLGISTVPILTAKPMMQPEAPAVIVKRRRKGKHAGTGWGRSKPGLNRSRHWRYAETYSQARALSPFPDRPVR